MDELQQRKNRRGAGGRAARHQVRNQPKPSFNPAAPGSAGDSTSRCRMKLVND